MTPCSHPVWAAHGYRFAPWAGCAVSENLGPSSPADALYGLDPDEFTAARNELAKALRAEGRKDDAAAVARLRRPPATAWALNAVARQRSELVEAVLDAGAELREAMERALAGDPTRMREAQVQERRAIDETSAAGASHLAASGRPAGDAARLRMAATLRAAVVDPAVADLLRRGVLDADRDAPGFGMDGFTVPAGPVTARRGSTATKTATERPRPGQKKKAGAPPTSGHDEGEGREKAAARDRAEAEARRAAQLEVEADEAEARSRQAERVAADAQRRATERRSAATAAAREAEQAVARSRRLQEEADDAEQQARAAREAADKAARQMAEARRRTGRDG